MFLHMCLVHTWPILCLLVTSMTVESLYLRAEHYKMLIPLALIYYPLNYYETKTAGKPVYAFLTWEDYTSPLICIGIQVVFTLVWIALAKLTKSCSSNSK